MLLVSQDDVFTIDVSYTYENGFLTIHEGEAPTGALKDSFTFRRPNWEDIHIMNSSSVIVDAINGKAIMDPYKYMDIKVKRLLKRWTLKIGQETAPVSQDNINRLHPVMMQHLFAKVEENLEPVKPPEPSTMLPVAE